MTRRKKEAPKEAIFKKATMPKEKVPITKTKGSKERSCEPNGEQEKKYTPGFDSRFRANVR